MLKKSAIDMLRKKGKIVFEANLERLSYSVEEEGIHPGSALVSLADRTEFDLHANESKVENRFAKTDLLAIFNGAVAAGKLNPQYQRAFQLMLGGLEDDEIARDLDIGTQAFQRMRYKIILKLQEFHLSGTGELR
ncbi:hypothetical protein C2U72_00965 [Prosthecomicrobium hirschii]|nr:hypothetical protein C2U72_00965 [Prosthecomicrobium hirschii]